MAAATDVAKDDPVIDPCCVCLDEITTDALMLVPCEHILHRSCYGKLKVCPLCRSEPTSAMPFVVRDDWDCPTLESVNDETSLADCPDSESWKKFVVEFEANVANDDFKSGVDVVVKTLDGERHAVKVPRSWTSYRLKEYLAVYHSKSHTPCGIRLVSCGAPMNDTDLVVPVGYDSSKRSLIVIHMIDQMRGS